MYVCMMKKYDKVIKKLFIYFYFYHQNGSKFKMAVNFGPKIFHYTDSSADNAITMLVNTNSFDSHEIVLDILRCQQELPFLIN